MRHCVRVRVCVCVCLCVCVCACVCALPASVLDRGALLQAIEDAAATPADSAEAEGGDELLDEPAGDAEAGQAVVDKRILEDPRAESMREYSVRMGKWKKDVREVINDVIFHVVCKIFRTAHSEVDHHQNFMQMRVPQSTSFDVGMDGGLHASQLSAGKALRMNMAFSASLHTSTWSHIIGAAPPDMADELMFLVVGLYQFFSSSYNRRLTKQVSTLPYTLCLLALSPYDEPCLRRQQLARSILDAPELGLEINARKIRFVHRAGLEEAAASGTVPLSLWSIGMTLRSMLFADVQRNEGHNSTIKHMCSRNRTIGLPSLSARMGVRAHMGWSGLDVAKAKFSRIRPQAASLLAEAGENVPEANSIISSETHRWTTPDPAKNLPSDEVVSACMQMMDPMIAKSPEWKWASVLSLLIGRRCKDIHSRYCLSFQNENLKAGDNVYFVSDKNYSLRSLTMWEVTDGPSPEGHVDGVLLVPFVHTDSVRLLTTFYAQLHPGPAADGGPAPEPASPISVRLHHVMRCFQKEDGMVHASIRVAHEEVCRLTKSVPKELNKNTQAVGNPDLAKGFGSFGSQFDQFGILPQGSHEEKCFCALSWPRPWVLLRDPKRPESPGDPLMTKGSCPCVSPTPPGIAGKAAAPELGRGHPTGVRRAVSPALGSSRRWQLQQFWPSRCSAWSCAGAGGCACRCAGWRRCFREWC